MPDSSAIRSALRTGIGAGLWPVRLREQDPELFAVAMARAVQRVRERLDADLAGASPEVREAIAHLDLRLEPDTDVRAALQQALSRAELPPDIRGDALLAIDGARLPRTPLDLLVDPGEDVLPRAEIDRAEVAAVSRAAGLEDASVERVLARAPAMAAISDDTVDALVREGALDERSARALGLAATIYELGGGDEALVRAVRAAELPQLPAGRVQSPGDLVALDAAAWRRMLDEAGVDPPEGLTRGGYSAALAERVARLFPTDAFLARLPRPTEQSAEVVERLAPLFERNESVVAGDFDDLDVARLEPGDVEALRDAHAGLASLARSYPGLDLADLLDDRSARPWERVARVRERIALLDRMQELNPTVELLALDLTADGTDLAGLRFDGISAEDRGRVVRTLQAQQRVFTLAGDIDTAHALLKAGYSSAVSVAQSKPEVIAARTGLGKSAAGDVHTTAVGTMADVTAVFGGILDATDGAFNVLGVGTVRPSIQDYLRRLPGYADLFGSQAYCSCRHCDSILSPAAYFVDLMLFVQQHVTTPVFQTRTDHVLNLKVRRPDLWSTPLTCANTTETVATLELVDEVLENYLATDNGYAGSLTDRAAVQAAVYGFLATSVESFDEPFVLPLARLRAYLGHVGVARGTIARTLGAAPQVVTSATLGVSERGRQLVVTRNVALPFLRAVYGIDLPVDAGVVPPFDAQQLLSPLSVTRQELGQILTTRFVTASGRIRIRSEKTDESSVQNDVERVHGLTPDALDRVHRFTRLWRHLPWRIGELDLLLTSLGVTTLTEAELDRLVTLTALAERIGVGAEEICALTGPVPRDRVDAATPALFDRLFNPPPFVTAGGLLPQDAVTFVHPALRDPGAGGAPGSTVHRLQAALGVTDEELLQLLAGLAPALGSNPTAPAEGARGFTLTAAHLSLLYRHARLAQLLGVPVADLIRLISFVPGLARGCVTDPGDLAALLDVRDWYAASGYSLDDLAVIRHHPPLDASAYPDPGAVTDALLAEITADRALTFADTVFAFLPGMTEELSRQLVKANLPRLTAVEGGYQLAADFRLDQPLEVPAELAVVDEPAARAALAAYHPSEVLPSRLAGKLGLPAEKVRALLALLGADLSTGAIPAALHGGPSDPLRALVADLVPLRVAFKADAWGPQAIAFVGARPRLFRVVDVRDLTVPALQDLGTYARLAAAPLSATGQPAPTAGADLRAALAAFDPVSKFPAAQAAALGRALDAEPGLVRTVSAALTLPGEAVAALAGLAAAVALARTLGVNGDTLRALLSDDFAELQRAADAVLGALRARVPEREWPARLDPLEDAVREQRRDALTDHLLHATFPQFQTRADLYEHFLIDVELTGCARTSRVVAAISSVQLYVHRILMNLEQDRRDPRDPAHVRVDPSRIPADEWEWRKNYRVWEANRKVFLWPENYLEPTLRDDKTPLFETLESTLLQSSVDEQHVLDAYADYLAGFDELAALRIAGCFHEKDPVQKQDVLHLIGVTSSDPPVFYYRAIKNAHYGVTEPGRGTVWEPWRKIDVQVGARAAAPIVHSGRLHLAWLEYATKPKNHVKGGRSDFIGYDHVTTLKFSTLRLDGRWTPPQRVRLSDIPPFVGDGALPDPLDGATIPVYDTVPHPEPREGYTLRGFPWDNPFPDLHSEGAIHVTLAGFGMHALVDLFDRTVRLYPGWLTPPLGLRLPRARKTFPLRELRSYTCWWLQSYASASLYVDPERLAPLTFLSDWGGVEQMLTKDPILSYERGATIDVVNGSLSDVILDDHGDLLLVQGSVRPAPGYLLRRLGTTMGRQMSRLLFTGGVGTLLDLATQQSLGEADLPVTPSVNVTGDGAAGRLDYTGAFGTYYQEVFHHIPELLATHLNGQQQFAAAQQWLHYLFDPTAAESVGGVAGSTEPGNTPWREATVGIFCDVDTSSAGLRETPVYLTSIGGASNHWELTGAAMIYNPTPTGFRVYLQRPGGNRPTVQEATNAMWTVQWVAVPHGRRCGTTTIPGHTNWQDYMNGAGIYCDVDTSAAGFADTPIYLTSLAGKIGTTVAEINAFGPQWNVTGASAVYSPTPTGFQINLFRPGPLGQPTPEEANSHGWVVQWLALPTGPAAGRTEPGATNWQAYGGPGGGVYCDVDTSAAGLSKTPVYLASIGGTGHWELTGTSAVDNATPTGFRVHLRRPSGPQPTPEEANTGQWAVQWTTGEHVVDEMVEQRRRDRPWRYLRFRGLDIPKLRATLTDDAAIEAYKKDPFNPHAIARLRVSAYQKSLVMRYVDNLLDWADSLFTQFTTESVNEATMLYVTAASILGDRPPQLGDCGEGAATPKTFEAIAPLLAKGSEFLAELETWVHGPKVSKRVQKQKASPMYVLTQTFVAQAKLDADALLVRGVLGRAYALTMDGPRPPLEVAAATLVPLARAAEGSGAAVIPSAAAGVAKAHAEAAVAVAQDAGVGPAALSTAAQSVGVSAGYAWHKGHISSWAETDLAKGGSKASAHRSERAKGLRAVVSAAGHAWGMVRQVTPAFCIPVNPELLSRWNRVEDRLTKIRHCRDINGVPRLLELFAPEIEPRLLVRARAAGLSLEDVLNATAGNLPPYRFAYLIDRAKAHAAVVQSFGAYLLSALEKRDVEELNKLRLVQQQNLLRLNTQVRQWEIDAATDAIETLERQREAVTFRRDHLRGLIETGLTGWETAQQQARHTATGLQVTAGAIDVLSGIAYLIPQLGSPFALKYGGKETGDSSQAWAMVLRDAAGVADAIAASAGLEATFQRRRQSWEHDAAAADKELRVLDKQFEAARIRFDIAVRAQRIHEETLEQIDEMFDYYSAKFSNLGLYTWLSSTLQRVYRQAYNGAYAMARLAEQAYRFERGDETSELLAPSYWDAAHAGLLAGERLQVDLHQLERRFLETNYRSLEVDQAFALTQVDPSALVALREKAECQFDIPEVFFDLAYPGHYRRKIKSVRLTIPCVTGPYTNVSATLTLLGSQLRNEPQPGAAALRAVPLRRSVSIATSTAQQDAGVFELNFRDERYMPFEGAGAVSSWRLTLPTAFRAFDYRTITDVILHVTYTAEADDLLRETVESQNAALEGAIRAYLTTHSLVRVYSLRHEHSAVFHRLLHQPIGTAVPLRLEQRSLPLFLQGMPLRATASKLALSPVSGHAVGAVSLTVNGTVVTGFAADPALGGLPSADATAAIGPAFLREHSLAVVAAGDLAPPAPVAGDLSALDADKLEDILVYVEYRLQ